MLNTAEKRRKERSENWIRPSDYRRSSVNWLDEWAQGRMTKEKMEAENADNCGEGLSYKEKHRKNVIAGEVKKKKTLVLVCFNDESLSIIFPTSPFHPVFVYYYHLILDIGHILPGLIITDCSLANHLNFRAFPSVFPYRLPGPPEFNSLAIMPLPCFRPRPSP